MVSSEAGADFVLTQTDSCDPESELQCMAIFFFYTRCLIFYLH